MVNLLAKIRTSKLPSKTPEGGHIELEKKVRYALNCLEAGLPHKVEKARAFLHDAKPRLDNSELISHIEKALIHGS